MEKKGNIGVFDSGLGGLWILKHLREKMPEYDYVFLGDQKNVSYGNKYKEELFVLATKAMDFLYKEKKCMGVILACNTISSTIYDELRDWKDKKYFGRILFGIVRPTVESLNMKEKTAIFATVRTCQSEIYESYFRNNLKSYQKIALPELAGLIENGGDTYSYLKSFQKEVPEDVKNGALLCTHYGIIRDDFKKVFPQISNWVYQEDIIPNYMKNYFLDYPERESFFTKNGSFSINVTKENQTFNRFKDNWFGDGIKIEIVDLN